MKRVVGYEDVRSGRVDFRILLRERRTYLDHMARYYARRLRRLAGDTRYVDVDDLRNIAATAMWKSVVAYEWRCRQCPRAAASAEDLIRHEQARHGEVRGPIGTIERYVHGEVGRALDHEVTRHVRRQKFAHAVYDPRYRDLDEAIVPPGQISWLEFRERFAAQRRVAR